MRRMPIDMKLFFLTVEPGEDEQIEHLCEYDCE
jgi:hypothetical protein